MSEDDDSLQYTEHPCWRCPMEQYKDCHERRHNEELAIYTEQKQHCTDEGNPDYISDEDWVLAISCPEGDMLELDLGKEDFI